MRNTFNRSSNLVSHPTTLHTFNLMLHFACDICSHLIFFPSPPAALLSFFSLFCIEIVTIQNFKSDNEILVESALVDYEYRCIKISFLMSMFFRELLNFERHKNFNHV